MRTKTLLGAVILLLLATPSLLAAANLSDARKLMDDGRYVAAVNMLEEITKARADDAKAWALLGEAELSLLSLQSAQTAVNRALEIDEENGAYWKLLGRVFLERGFQAVSERRSANEITSWFADAEMKFKECLKRDEKDPEILWWIGWAREGQGPEYADQAKDYYRKAIEKFPKDPGGYRRLGALLSQEANGTGGGMTAEAKAVREEALKVLAEGQKKAGPDAESLFLRGLAYEWNRDREAALESYVEAIQADPELHKAWARHYKLVQDDSVLLPLALKLLKKDPTAPTPAMWATFFLKEKEPERALDIAMKALKVHREHSGLYTQASIVAANLLQSRKANEAIEGYKKIHEYYTLSGDAANNVGLYYRDTGNYKESLAWYLKSLERAPDNQDILNDTALIYLFHMSGAERKKCLPMLQKVVELVVDEGQQPMRGYWDALENLCKYYWEVDRNPELVVKYADMRYVETGGVKPYNMSEKAAHYRKLAEKEMGK